MTFIVNEVPKMHDRQHDVDSDNFTYKGPVQVIDVELQELLVAVFEMQAAVFSLGGRLEEMQEVLTRLMKSAETVVRSNSPPAEFLSK